MNFEYFIRINNRNEIIKPYAIKNIEKIDVKKFYDILLHEKHLPANYMFTTINKQIEVILSNDYVFIDRDFQYNLELIDFSDTKRIIHTVKLYNTIRRNNNQKLRDLLFILIDPYKFSLDLFTYLDDIDIVYGINMACLYAKELFTINKCETIDDIIDAAEKHKMNLLKLDDKWDKTLGVIDYFDDIYNLAKIIKNSDIKYEFTINSYKRDFIITLLFENINDYQLFFNAYLDAYILERL